MRLPLYALSAAAFGIGTTEFVIMGLLPEVAHDLGVTIPQAGLLVSGYAIGVTIGAPIVAIATARLKRHVALLSLMGIFILGNLMCALAPSYWPLMIARIVTAFCHGAFFGVGAVVAADLSPPGRKAQAIAMMFAGLTLANVLGVPFGTALGQALGWRSTFWAVVGIGLLAALALIAWLPRTLGRAEGNMLTEFGVLKRPQVILAMLISVMASASLFSVFTYIAPILTDVTGVSPHGVTLVLLLFGVGLTVGNFAGAKLADWRMLPAMIGILATIIALQVIFYGTAPSLVPAVATIFLWGVAAFALVAPLQLRVVAEANGAPNLASSLNQGAFNLGNAIGAWAGGVAITAGVGYGNLPWLGAGLALAALVLTLVAGALERRAMAGVACAGE